MLQGSLLSIGVVFVNMSVFSLKQHLKNAVRRLENQLLRDAAPAQRQAQPAVAAAAAGHVALQGFPAAGAAAAAGEAGAGSAGAAAQSLAGAASAGAGQHAGALHGIGQGTVAGVATSSGLPTALHGGGAAATSSAGTGSSSSGTPEAPATQLHTAAVEGSSGSGVSTGTLGHGSSSGLQLHPSQQAHLLQQQPSVGDALVAAAAAVGVDAVGPGADEAMLAAAAAVGAVADPGGGVDGVPAEAADVWGDVPIEELLGLQVGKERGPRLASCLTSHQAAISQVGIRFVTADGAQLVVLVSL